MEEWIKIVAPLAAGIAGILLGIWHAGRKSGKEEASEETRLNERLEAKVKEAIQPFDETIRGIRQKINDVELSSEKRFMLKDDFNDFREEYREDMRDLKKMIQNGHG